MLACPRHVAAFGSSGLWIKSPQSGGYNYQESSPSTRPSGPYWPTVLLAAKTYANDALKMRHYRRFLHFF